MVSCIFYFLYIACLYLFLLLRELLCCFLPYFSTSSSHRPPRDDQDIPPCQGPTRNTRWDGLTLDHPGFFFPRWNQPLPPPPPVDDLNPEPNVIDLDGNTIVDPEDQYAREIFGTDSEADIPAEPPRPRPFIGLVDRASQHNLSRLRLDQDHSEMRFHPRSLPASRLRALQFRQRLTRRTEQYLRDHGLLIRNRPSYVVGTHWNHREREGIRAYLKHRHAADQEYSHLGAALNVYHAIILRHIATGGLVVDSRP